jgi:orotate phosphoribosyltransferase
VCFRARVNAAVWRLRGAMANDNKDMVSREQLARHIYETSSLKGQFRLRSGAFSDEYFDKYLFESNPALLKEIAEGLRSLVPPETEALAGLEMGGIPIATVLSQLTGIPVLFVRKTAKQYGTCKFAEGGEVAGRKLVIVEDVVTSGGQIIESANALRAEGAEIIRVLCVIDRQSGGVENLAASDLELRALFTMMELKQP